MASWFSADHLGRCLWLFAQVGSPEEKDWWGGVILACVLVIPALMPSRHVDGMCGMRGECWEVMEWKVRALGSPSSRK